MKSKLIALLCAGLLANAPAFAGFIGHTVSADYAFPDVGTVLFLSGTAVAGAGVEFNNVGGFGVGSSPSVDFSDNSILVTYPAGFSLAGTGSFDGWVFTDLTSSDIVGVSLAGTNLAGLTGAGLSFNSNHVYLDTLGLGNWGAGTFISVDVVFAGGVPEPNALALASLALVLLGSATARRQRVR